MLFTLMRHAKPEQSQTPLGTRTAHLNRIEQTGIVRMTSPPIADGGMRGSVMALDADSTADAEGWVAGAPYTAPGLFDSVTVMDLKKVIG
ncbi:hypothetical protein DEA8626_02567 [Defluviimonas aquaemixtae]|uniref:YCII-related domain-containing protein n=1 Tax=Albidovulum aquaemixtae TaxID=1542388 RepID=A0A2R8BJG5_9RHOB|nr:YciI family protein [Defluviimonas aquaemixtae]SPH23503.1 hypothetical protein DEA8626_02567 [Defluviimonas aquaemixtae]